MHAIKDELHNDDVSIKMSFAQKDIIRSKMKRKRENTSVDNALSKSHKLMRHTSHDVLDSSVITSIPRMTIEAAKPTNKDVFKTTNDSFTTSVQHQVQTSKSRKALSQHLGVLSQEYSGDFLSGGEKNKITDIVYGVFKDRTIMLGSKEFDVYSIVIT